MKKHTLKNILAISLITVIGAAMTGCGSSVEDVQEANTVLQDVDAEEKTDEEVNDEAGTNKEVDDDSKQENKKEVKKEATYQELYKAAVEEFQNEKKESETEYCKLCYDLIYFDDDDIPELVMGLSGYYVYMYTIIDGEMVPIIDNWPC